MFGSELRYQKQYFGGCKDMLLRTSDCLLKLLKEGDLAVFSHLGLHRYIYLCSRHWKRSKDEGIYTFILGNLDLQVRRFNMIKAYNYRLYVGKLL